MLELQNFNKTQAVIEKRIKFTINSFKKYPTNIEAGVKINLSSVTIGHPTDGFLRIFQIM